MDGLLNPMDILDVHVGLKDPGTVIPHNLSKSLFLTFVPASQGPATMSSRLTGPGGQSPPPTQRRFWTASSSLLGMTPGPPGKTRGAQETSQCFGSGCNSGFQQRIKIASRTYRGWEGGELIPSFQKN